MPEPRAIEVRGDYVHVGTGLAFPAAAAGFDRIAPKQYDVEGNDVGIGYRRTWNDAAATFRAEVTIFVFPHYWHGDGTPMPPDEQFEGEVLALRNGRSEVREVRRVDIAGSWAGRGVTATTAEFEFRGGAEQLGMTMTTLVTGIALDPWRVTYRVTVPSARRDETLAGVDELLSALGMPPLGVPTAAQ